MRLTPFHSNKYYHATSGPPATSKALLRVRGHFFSDNATMPTIHIQISSIFLSLYIVDIKKCANLQQIQSKRVNKAFDAINNAKLTMVFEL